MNARRECSQPTDGSFVASSSKKMIVADDEREMNTKQAHAQQISYDHLLYKKEARQ